VKTDLEELELAQQVGPTAAQELLEDLVVPPALEEPEELPTDPQLAGAMAVLRRGLRESPELRRGLGYTVFFAMLASGGQLLVPVLIQQILDRGLAHGFHPEFIYPACGLAALAVVFVYFAARTAYARMVGAAEAALYGLRVRVFSHIHHLSLAEQTARRKGTYVARVTSDMDQLSMFMDWGGISWIYTSVLVLATVLVMFIYSWQLALITILCVAPIALVLRRLQRGMLRAYDQVRTRVGETLSEVSESLLGVAVVRAYGIEADTDRRLRGALRNQYDAQLHANRYMAVVHPAGDIFGAIAIAAVVAVGAIYGPRWGLSLGQVVAFLFLVNLFLSPVAELSESMDQTQTAIAGWRKILSVLDLPVEIGEPESGMELPPGALAVRLENLSFAYRGADMVLEDIDIQVPAGAHVAIVGETGQVAPAARRQAIRMIPQDGFLFATSVRENVRYGRPGATDNEVAAAFSALDLQGWVATLPQGLNTEVGERGENLSVGERQLVALVRAQLGGAGLLILDEATSAVDPETERRLNLAMQKLSLGRTTITIAHRLSSAERADQILVLDRGRVVERGRHLDLVAGGGVYAALYASWLGSTRGS
jgi:putative ABC transport system ATP-binding protein